MSLQATLSTKAKAFLDGRKPGSPIANADLADEILLGTRIAAIETELQGQLDQHEYDFGDSSEVTIAAGVATVTQALHTVDTEADASSDDLDTITNADAVDGDVLRLMLANAARNVVVKHGTGNIRCPGAQDITLDLITDVVVLEKCGSNWIVIGRSIEATEAPPVLVKTGTIAYTAVRTLNATPVEMIPAPGAGKYIEVLRIHWWLDYGTAAYDSAAAGDTLEAKYTNGSGAAVCDAVAGNAIGAASADYHTLVNRVLEVIPVANAAIVAHINSGEWYAAAGDSPLKYEIEYRIRTLDFN